MQDTDVWQSMGTLINRFRERPGYFFTEADIVAYLCHVLYGKDRPVEREDFPQFVKQVHLEYPTSFRYAKNSLCEHEGYDPCDEITGSRGHHDMVVLSEKFVRQTPIKVVVNKSNAASIAHHGTNPTDDLPDTKFDESMAFQPTGPVRASGRGVDFAIEFKYVISNSSTFVDQVCDDNWKLHWARKMGAAHAVNLVFCNICPGKPEQLQQVVRNTPDGVICCLVQAHWDGASKKTPKPLTNSLDAEVLRFLHAVTI